MDAQHTAGNSWFVADEGHTLAGMIRPYLLSDDPSEVSYAIATDPMCDRAGIRIRCDGLARVNEAFDRALRLVDAWEAVVDDIAKAHVATGACGQS